MENLKGIGYLRAKLGTVRGRVLTRYEYYEIKHNHMMPEVAIPRSVSMRYRSKLGWCTKAVDALADRLVVTGFSNDRFNMESIFNVNNPDVLFDSAILGALISSCDFIYINPVGKGIAPRLQVIDGSNATGIIDPVTCLLKEGYAVLERDPDTGNAIMEAYFAPGFTDYIYNGKHVQRVENDAEYPLLVPIINRPDSKRFFGHSRISRSCMDTQDKAEDTLTRINVISEIGSWPQKYVLGLSEMTAPLDNLNATVSQMLRFDKDEDGDRPTVGQFQQMTMTPHLDTFKLLASNFSGETGLTMDDLGFASSNPSSAEAIKACHESLRVTASKAQKTFATGFINTGFLAVCVRDGMQYKREEVYKTSVKWRPIIEPDAAMLSSIGDGAIKINQAIPGYFDKNTLAELTGIEASAEDTGEGLDAFIQSLTEGGEVIG